MIEETEVLRIYEGSNGEETIRLFKQLELCGSRGRVAIELFRAQKASSRAKVYRGGNGHGSYRQQAYARKEWAMENLCRVLMVDAAPLGIAWGWKADPNEPIYPWVLYVEIPTGQVSFHTASRGLGPEYSGEWDGIRGASPARLARWIANL